MKADALLFGAIIVFLFILWLYNGGPNNPISFSGPYITPITDVGQTSSGYGDTHTSAGSAIWESVTSALGSSGSGSSGTGKPSSYANSVFLGSGDAASSDVRSEYLTIRVSGSSPVDITGWRLVSEKTGASATIGQGVVVAKRTDSVDILLASGDKAIVVTGHSPIGDSFLETECTGYLADDDTFSPRLSTGSCPAPLDELSDYYGGTNASSYDKCEKYVSGYYSCSVPSNDSSSDAPSSCRNFIKDELTYNGCVSNHRTDTDFQGDTWRVYLDQSRELWRSSNDTIDLLDKSGNRVAQYSY